MQLKNLIAGALLLPSLAFGQANAERPSLQMSTYQTICLDGKDLSNLLGEYKEIPFARGKSKPIVGEGVLSLVIFINPNTKSFTIAERAGQDLFCVLAVGSEFEPMPKEIQDNVINEYNKGTL